MENVERLASRTTFNLRFAFYLIPKVIFFTHYITYQYITVFMMRTVRVISKTSFDETDTPLGRIDTFLFRRLTPSPASSPGLFPLRKLAPIKMLDCFKKKVAKLETLMTVAQPPFSLIFIQVSIGTSPLRSYTDHNRQTPD